MTTTSDARQAERIAKEQRMSFAALLRVDLDKAGSPAAVGLCSKVAETAESDPLKWDAMLGDAKVAILFARGALYFGKAAA